MNKGCYLNKTFQVICNESTHSAYLPSLKLDTDAISVSDHLIRVTGDKFLAIPFNKSSGESPNGHSFYYYLEDTDHFSVSTSRNKFVAVGCDFYAYMVGNGNREFLGGCASLCNCTDIEGAPSSCLGLGCCKTDFPENVENITVWVETMNTDSRSWSNDACGYFGIMDKDYRSFNASKFSNCKESDGPPMIMEWAVGSTRCPVARKRKDYTCGQNTDCVNNSRGSGYRCTCIHDFKGNPNIYNGCSGNHFQLLS